VRNDGTTSVEWQALGLAFYGYSSALVVDKIGLTAFPIIEEVQLSSGLDGRRPRWGY